jgi:hypothetical protein
MKRQRKPQFKLLDAYIGQCVEVISTRKESARPSKQVVVETVTGRYVTRHIQQDEAGDWWAFVSYGPKGEKELARVGGVK